MANKVRFLVPDLWADHHVIKARQALLGTAGVAGVNASSAFKEVTVEYDPAVATTEQLATVLVTAGYPPAAGISQEDGTVVYGEFDAMWRERGSRVTTTNNLDRDMSGDFRRY